MIITKANHLRGELKIPGDKSISHRGVMFGSIASGVTELDNFLEGTDCLSTIRCFSRMGVSIDNRRESGRVIVRGAGLHGLKAPDGILDCGNSGTTMRLMSGILAAQPFDCILTGDSSIQKRPMKRIMDPLSLMGADISSIPGNGCAPLRIRGRALRGISYSSPVASAQVKSSILLGGLFASGETRVTEPYVSRNHTELMLKSFGADVSTEGTTAIIRPAEALYGQSIHVPGDISSAAFFLAAGLLVPGSEILIKNVGINPTRDGVLRVFLAMGGHIEILNRRENGGEPVADLLVTASPLKAAVVEGALIPTLIDELPVIAAAACLARGTTVIRDAAELKVKESNRIRIMAHSLTAMGARVTETDDGMIIDGGAPLHGAVIDSHGDHRIAMTFAVLGLVADGETEILYAECADVSYPTFYEDLRRLSR